MLTIPAVAYLLAQNRIIQNKLAEDIIQYLSGKFETQITTSSFRYSLYHKLIFNDLCIYDQKSDTLIYAKRLNVNIKDINFPRRVANIRSIEIEKGLVNFYTDTQEILNLQFFIDSLKSKDSTKQKWEIDISKLNTSEVYFKYKDYRKTNEIREGVNLSDLNLKNLELKLRDFEVSDDSVKFDITGLSFIEKSGFNVNSFSGLMSISNKFIHFKNLDIHTDYSDLTADKFQLNFRSSKDLKYITSKVNFVSVFKNSRLSFIDISYFAAKDLKYHQEFILNGNIYGRINSLKGKDVLINYNEKTNLHLNFNINGLPDINNTFLYLDIKNLVTNANDIDQLNIPLNEQKTVKVSKILNQFGTITYSGNFTGFYNDFVAYGLITTGLGNFSTDISLVPAENRFIGFKGKINAHNFNIGKLIKQEKYLGNLTLSTNIEGYSMSGNKLIAVIDGTVHKMEANGYLYNNINLNGELTDKTFDGSLKIEDPNIEFQFSGRVDFSNTIPVFDFTAYAPKINLKKLNFDKNANNSTISFVMEADITGNTFNNMNGKISILNSVISRNNDQLEINNMQMFAREEIGTKKFTVKSGFFDLEIAGNYYFENIFTSLKKSLNNYFPTLINSKEISDTLNDFTYRVDFKNITPVCELLTDSFCISENSFIQGEYTPKKDHFVLNSFINNLKYQKLNFSSLSIKSSSNNYNVKLDIDSKEIEYENLLNLVNYKFRGRGYNDSIKAYNSWNNLDTNENSGNITANIKFDQPVNGVSPIIYIDIVNSGVIVDNNFWKIDPSTIKIDSTGLYIKNEFNIQHNNQNIRFYGNISKNKNNKFNITTNNLEIIKLNAITNLKSFNLNGFLSGKATISDLFTDPYLISEFKVDSFSINKEIVGDLFFTTKWDNNKKRININGYTKKGRIENLNLNGIYIPEGRLIDFDLEMNKLKIDFFNPVFANIFSDIYGMSSGNLSVNGTLKKPVLNGKLFLQKTVLKVDFLNTKYSFTNNIILEDNNIILPDIKLFDTQNNYALINGAIKNSYFNDWVLNINIQSNNVLCLNTTELDNSDFFGTVYANGLIQINGPVNNIVFDITAKSSPGTVFYIPLYDQSGNIKSDFITFKSNNEQDLTGNIESENYNISTSGIQLNMDIEVTPDAETQLIFDSKIGDIIKSRGNGNLLLEINQYGEFQIFGDYVIEKGDYLFTLQNVINKRFNVKSGGDIVFNGNPYEAQIDIEANYNLRTSIYDLVRDGIDEANKGFYDRRFPVECKVFLTGELLNPSIDLDIELLNSDEETKLLFDRELGKGAGLEQTDNTILNKQFLSLMVINQFTPGNTGFYEADMYGKSASVTTSEMLSNQLSNWLSQINDNWDIGFNYRYDSDLSEQQMEVALSTQVLNDRMTLNGNVDLAGNNTQSNDLIGDFEIEYRLSKSGKLKLKAYHKSNESKLDFEESPHTQGVGLFYREEFDSFNELWKYYLTSFTMKDSTSN